VHVYVLQLLLVLIVPTREGTARLSWPGGQLYIDERDTRSCR